MEENLLIYTNPDKRIGLITFNRPHVMNAFDIHALRILNSIIDQLADDDKVRIVILTGAGGNFSTGNDLKAKITPDEINEAQRLGREIVIKLMYLPQITIAGIQGFALGGGFEIALGCDLRVASTNAKMGLPELTFGYPIAWAGWNLLTYLVGLPLAKEITFLGERMDAERAKAIGLISRIFPTEQFMELTLEFASSLKKMNPELVQLSKFGINYAIQANFTETTQMANTIFEANYSKDRKQKTKEIRENLLNQIFMTKK